MLNALTKEDKKLIIDYIEENAFDCQNIVLSFVKTSMPGLHLCCSLAFLL